MKNLELLELTHQQPQNTFEQAKLFAQTADSLYFIRGNSLHRYDFGTAAAHKICEQSFDGPIRVKILAIEARICVATANELHIIGLDGAPRGSAPFAEPIAAISWNPTEELVVTVSEDGAVRSFSVDYENGDLYSQGASGVGAPIPDTVYVGWGSRDTQFRGSEGKLRKTAPVVAEPINDEKPRISWRGNGEMFAVNYWVDQKRQFVVFETPCKAMFRSEECPGLQPTIAWRPAGNMIATLCKVGSTESVVIFEKNGQKRFNFDLSLNDDVCVRELKWSPCAQILTVYSENLSTNEKNIHLLTSSNYQWYEKQTLTFSDQNPLLDFDWLETTQSTFTLRAITANEIVTYTFRSAVNQSHATCAVINGKSVQLTNFAEEIIPPPLFSKQFVNEAPINFVIFNDNQVSVVDSKNRIKTFDVGNPEAVTSTRDLGEIVKLPTFPVACHHFLARGQEIYFAAETESETVFYGFNQQNADLNFIDAVAVPFRHLSVGNTVGMSQIGTDLFINEKFPENSVKLSVAGGFNCQLTANCHFYVNCQKVSDCVNSFTIFQGYLLFTTKTNELHCVRLGEGCDFDKTYKRSIEQGANIVTAIPNSPKVVLQLPRGNLETISCRLISIDILNRLLNGAKWAEALRFIRLEKLNANLLFDLDPDRFLNQVGEFVANVKTVNELNSLCLEFEENNVLETLYANWGDYRGFPDKIPTIFSKILEYFDETDYVPYVSTIMVICLNFFTLKEALVYLQDLLRRSYEDFSLKKTLNEAVNTLKTYGCDQEKLYTECLLLYDLDLAHFTASCCQMDPRIYEPHLANLRNLPEIKKRYEIHIFAKQPKLAISYLLRIPQTETSEIAEFLKTHQVAREAYFNCHKQSPHYQSVSREFAGDLSRKGWHDEAAAILKRAGLIEEALQEYKLALKWRDVLDLLGQMQIGDAEKMTIVNDMAARLVQRHVIKDAAVLYEYYADNYEMAVKVLIEHYCLEEALHVAKKHGRADIVVADILPVLGKHKSDLEETIRNLGEIFDKYKARLGEVRRLKLAKFSCYDDRDDLFSDVGSVVSKSSRSSRSSTASSRNRRKEERKKQDLREGGIYEDIALIRAVHCLIFEFYKKGDEVRSCCMLLMQESDFSVQEIKVLHDLYSTLGAKIKESLSEIWPSHFYLNNPTQDLQEVADLENLEHLDVEYRTPPKSPPTSSLNIFL